jgi:hypothetical protein
MKIKTKKQIIDGVLKLNKSSLIQIFNLIQQNHPNIKYITQSKGMLFNMKQLSDTTLKQILLILDNIKNNASAVIIQKQELDDELVMLRKKNDLDNQPIIDPKLKGTFPCKLKVIDLNLVKPAVPAVPVTLKRIPFTESSDTEDDTDSIKDYIQDTIKIINESETSSESEFATSSESESEFETSSESEFETSSESDTEDNYLSIVDAIID